jgi:hypothetical protein
MKNVPHWQWLVVIYLIVVALPVLTVHQFFKKRALANRTFGNLLIYFVSVLGSAFLLHSVAMYFYFTFFFTVRH